MTKALQECSLPASPPLVAVHRLACFPCWLAASSSSSAIQQHETRDLTRPINNTQYPVLRVCPTGARSPPCCRASIRGPPGLGPGLVAHFKRQSKLRHSSRNTAACFRSLRPGPLAKGDAANPGTGPILVLSSSQQPSRAPVLFFETAAVGWLTSWLAGRSNLAFALPAA